ncbi:sulfatase-like hydrolase/transferase [Nocardioides sp. zg-579]|uniref:Sulfatase-like hydrolase/transferase n=1 Tax=Nocardioides marmotae TaxID=2663857 RepID=A0A6I3JFE8_9ACTN|nr:alkaline phosphatase family protein [Nocardioides marmotae]MCR6033297.1 sulfatase-like hydrolase/transferase [Gordonia jinghuaiqii]MTB96954.1 sulfatase-like hydrolase/transferase [Nocardioides marmotae]QKE00664.1 sulfatase-like hydrolase/transferase [Nocardioides marmotae]
MRRTSVVAAAVAALLPLSATPVLAGTAPCDGPPRTAAATVPAGEAGRRVVPEDRRVLAISVDGLNPAALARLGEQRTPVLHRLLAQGASTRNARTARELTLTLPNHTGMVTGRRIDAAKGGHGVTWNTHRPGTTVQRAAGHAVASVFSVVRAASGESVVFTGKEKFTLFERSWPRGVDALTYEEDPLALVKAARRDLRHEDRALTFVHLATPDVAGHANGFMSRSYLDAVARADRLIGKLVRAVEGDAELRREVVVVLTADHGGRGAGHYDATRYADYRVPFLVWGRGIEAADLYRINPDRSAPGRSRTSYAGRQPVRNGDLANVVTRLLGLGPVPGSELGRTDPLVVDRD